MKEIESIFQLMLTFMKTVNCSPPLIKSSKRSGLSSSGLCISLEDAILALLAYRSSCLTDRKPAKTASRSRPKGVSCKYLWMRLVY